MIRPSGLIYRGWFGLQCLQAAPNWVESAFNRLWTVPFTLSFSPYLSHPLALFCWVERVLQFCFDRVEPGNARKNAATNSEARATYFEDGAEAASWSPRPSHKGRCSLFMVHPSVRTPKAFGAIQVNPGKIRFGSFARKFPANRVRNAAASGSLRR
jgi:hypothetical protein